MGNGRWRVGLVEEVDRLPVEWRPPGRQRRREIRQDPGETSKAALVTAFALLAKRGTGPTAWAASFRHDPIAFLLDTSSDAVSLWAEGGLLYRNRAAERLGIGRAHPGLDPERLSFKGLALERRCCRFRLGRNDYLLEIIGPGAG